MLLERLEVAAARGRTWAFAAIFTQCASNGTGAQLRRQQNGPKSSTAQLAGTISHLRCQKEEYASQTFLGGVSVTIDWFCPIGLILAVTLESSAQGV